MYYTYIIFSSTQSIYYKGYTENPEKRLWEHNNNLSRFTSGKGPWALVYLKKHPTKTEALQAERKLKKAGSAYLQRLISAYKSEVG